VEGKREAKFRCALWSAYIFVWTEWKRVHNTHTHTRHAHTRQARRPYLKYKSLDRKVSISLSFTFLAKPQPQRSLLSQNTYVYLETLKLRKMQNCISTLDWILCPPNEHCPLFMCWQFGWQLAWHWHIMSWNKL
jgi:hypothetical protein